MHRAVNVSNWIQRYGLAPLILSAVSEFYAGFAIADSLKVTPPTLMPDNVVSITGGTCASYRNNLLSNGVSVNGVNHPGECQHTNFEVLFEGLPFKQYWEAVSSGARPAPYTVTRAGPFCYDASDIHVHISVQAQTSRLNWVSGKPADSACTKEWNREQTAVSNIRPDTITQVENILSQVSRDFAPGKMQECGAQVPVGDGGTSPQQRLASRIAALLAGVNATVRGDIDRNSRHFEIAAVQAACTLHCNQCDYSGWAGTINMTARVTNPNGYQEDLTESYFVGGAATPLGVQKLYPAEWELTQSGHVPSTYGTTHWQLSASSSGGCAPQVVCFEEAIDPLTNKLSFTEISSALQIANSGQIVEYDSNRKVVSTSIEAFEINPETVGITFQGPMNTTALMGSTQVSPNYLFCNPAGAPSGATCTMQWTWDLSKQ